MAYIATDTFIADMGFSQQFAGDSCSGELLIVPELCVPGTGAARAAVLATLSDMATGSISSAATAPKVCMTLDLSVRIFLPAEGTIRIDAHVLKSGRTTTVAEAEFRSSSGALVALSWATFVASPRPEDVLEMPRLSFGAPRVSRLTAPLEQQTGCRVVAPGVTEVDRVPYVMNPAGTVQGGMIALLAELAVESLEPGCAVTELDVRYLTATRVGPARATASPVARGAYRVELRDPGNGDRVTAVVLVRTA